jgi:hypothetical protein
MSREPIDRSGRADAAPRARSADGGGANEPAPPADGGRATEPAPPADGGRATEPARSHPTGGASAVADLVLMLVAFAACSAIAGLAGAPNLGTALTFGQIGFALVAVYVLLAR